MSANTCKTNLSPQLIFRQSYSGYTQKTFVGNWTKKGFWITKFRLQLIDFRPDIIANFKILNLNENRQIEIRYSIGFSSLFFALFWIFFASTIFIPLGNTGYIIGFLFLTMLHSILTRIELDRLKNSIKDKLFAGIKIDLMK
jgi:hypothetical protein